MFRVLKNLLLIAVPLTAYADVGSLPLDEAPGRGSCFSFWTFDDRLSQGQSSDILPPETYCNGVWLYKPYRQCENIAEVDPRCGVSKTIVISEIRADYETTKRKGKVLGCATCRDFHNISNKFRCLKQAVEHPAVDESLKNAARPILKEISQKAGGK